MALFAISYDLIKRKDYPELWAELERLGAQKVHLSFYFLDANNTAAEVFAHLRKYIDSDDRIMVIQFSTKPAWNVGLKGTQAWIDARFP